MKSLRLVAGICCPLPIVSYVIEVVGLVPLLDTEKRCALVPDLYAVWFGEVNSKGQPVEQLDGDTGRGGPLVDYEIK